MNRSTRVLTVSGILALGLTVVAGPAQARELDESADLGGYCWGEVDTGLEACAASPKELAQTVYERFNIVFENEGEALELTVDSDALSTSAIPISAPAVGARATWILGVSYADRDGGGHSHTASSSTTQPCLSGGGEWLYNFNTPYIMNDNVESVYPVAPCKIKVYADIDKGGSASGWMGPTGDIGGMRNVVSSVVYQGGH